MKTTYAELPNHKGQFIFSLDIKDIEQERKKIILGYNESLNIKGFRKGKIPTDMILKKVGALHIIEEASERALPRLLEQGMKENNIEMYGQPDVKLTKVTEAGPIELEITFTRMPQVELKTYTGLGIARKEVTINPDDITNSLEELRNLGATHTKVDRPSQKGDKVIVDFEAFLNSVPLEGGKATGHPIVLGESRNMFIPGFEENLIGMKSGEKKEFKLTFPKDYGKKDLAGREAEFRAHTKEVHEVKKPELSDELAKKMGNFTTLDELKKQLEDNVREDAKQKEEQRYELELIHELIKKNSIGEIPPEMLRDELERMMNELKHSVEHQGGKFEEYLQSIKRTESTVRKDLEPKARERIQTALLLRNISEKENLHARDNEVDALVEQELEHHKNNKEMIEQIKTPAYRRHVANVLTSKSVLQYVKEHNTKKT